jgi:hypothetical protein
MAGIENVPDFLPGVPPSAGALNAIKRLVMTLLRIRGTAPILVQNTGSAIVISFDGSITGLPKGITGDTVWHNGVRWTVLHRPTVDSVLTYTASTNTVAWAPIHTCA